MRVTATTLALLAALAIPATAQAAAPFQKYVKAAESYWAGNERTTQFLGERASFPQVRGRWHGRLESGCRSGYHAWVNRGEIRSGDGIDTPWKWRIDAARVPWVIHFCKQSWRAFGPVERALLVVHETGHKLGWPHTTSGIMYPMALSPHAYNVPVAWQFQR